MTLYMMNVWWKLEFLREVFTCPILFFVYAVELQCFLESLRVFYHWYTDDTQNYFIVESITEGENKLGVISSKVNRWMRSRRLKLDSDKTNCILVTEKNSIHRNVDIHSVMLGNTPVQLSNSVQYLGFVFDNQLNLDEQFNNAKRKIIFNLLNNFCIAEFIDKEPKIKLVHGLVFSIFYFCNTFY